LAAILGEVSEQVVHARELGAVNQVAAAGLGAGQPCMAQGFEVKRQSAGCDLQQGGEGAWGQALGARHDQGAKSP